jgi:hypothetical protein
MLHMELMQKGLLDAKMRAPYNGFALYTYILLTQESLHGRKFIKK